MIDCHALNKQKVKNRYPLPRIDDPFDHLQGARIFSDLNLLSGYHQVPLHTSDVPKTSFRTPQGNFQVKVLSMGLTDVPFTFAHVMNRSFQDQIHQLNKIVLMYLDDILLSSKTAKEHVEHVREVLQTLRPRKLSALQI